MSAIDWVLFQRTFGYGTTRAGKLLQRFDSAKAIFAMTQAELRESGCFSAEEQEHLARADRTAAERLLDFCDENGYAVLTPDSADYPTRLRELFSPPAALYVMGSLSGIDETLCIAVVGTRRATGYGIGTAKRISAELAEAGVVTVSGLAQGIDTACHRATVDAGGRTVAVQGCGLDITYPAANRGLKKEILRSGGAVVSEFPPGEESLPFHFPIRNRIISGLSNGTLVVEGTRRSGSLITAAHALSQSRDVFAVPGNVNEPMADGTNWLIRQGAVLVTGAQDILEEYRALLPELPPKKPQPAHRRNLPAPPEQTALPQPPDFLDETQQTLYKLLGAQPSSCDDLVERSGFTVPQVLTAMTQLEILGVVNVYPGRLFGR